MDKDKKLVEASWWERLAVIYGPNIPGSYAIVFYTPSDFTSITSHIHNWALFLLWLCLFILSWVISPLFSSKIWTPTDLGSSFFSVTSFCLFILFMGFSRQECWSVLPFPSPVDHDLSELSSGDSAYNAGDPGLIPGSGRSPGEGNGNPLQYSCLENSMDGGAWWATVHGVAKNQTWLSDLYTHTHTHTHTQFIVTIKYCIYSPCGTIYPCGLFILYIIVCTS